MQKPIYFNGAGLITAIGRSVPETLASIENGISKPANVNIEQAAGPLELAYFTIAQPGIDSGVERMYQIIDNVIQQAIDDAGLSTAELNEAGLFIGSTSFDMFQCEQAIKASNRTDADIDAAIPVFNHFSDYIQDKFSIAGPSFTFNTACTSSANALMYAAESIRRGDISHAIVVGLEFYNEVTALGFCGLELVSKQGMRPFSKQRDGLYLGEGCGALVISSEANSDKAQNFVYICGANIGDNYSITASNPDGGIVTQVVERALARAAITVDDIALIKAHGTASLSNDEAEAVGLQRAFTNAVPAIVCLKPYIGHTLGACGINELIIFYHALAQGSALFSSESETEGNDIDEAFCLRQATSEDVEKAGYYLLNYFGFGGNSTALVIAHA